MSIRMLGPQRSPWLGESFSAVCWLIRERGRAGSVKKYTFLRVNDEDGDGLAAGTSLRGLICLRRQRLTGLSDFERAIPEQGLRNRPEHLACEFGKSIISEPTRTGVNCLRKVLDT